jgi:4-methyl-5(b-hydroxyethyl)-thiazole monophosphate biosynthesis
MLFGKRAVCFPGFEEYLSGAKLQNKRVVRDGRIITAVGMGAALEFGLEIVAAVNGRKAADALAAAVIAPGITEGD